MGVRQLCLRRIGVRGQKKFENRWYVRSTETMRYVESSNINRAAATVNRAAVTAKLRLHVVGDPRSCLPAPHPPCDLSFVTPRDQRKPTFRYTIVYDVCNTVTKCNV